MYKYVILLLFFIMSCASVQEKNSEKSSHEKVSSKTPYSTKRKSPIVRRAPPLNLDQVQDALKMHYATENLGFRQKRFNPCGVDRRQTNCKKKYFSVVNIRIQCRSSMGTVEHVSNYELKPLAYKSISWKLGLYRGELQTDSGGFAQIRVITPGSSYNQNLRIRSEKHLLRLR